MLICGELAEGDYLQFEPFLACCSYLPQKMIQSIIYYQYIMNNRALKSSNNNKKPLQIIRTHKIRTSKEKLGSTGSIKQHNFRYFDSSKEVLASTGSSQNEKPSQPEQKKISFSETRQTYAYEQENSGSLQKNLKNKSKGRSSSVFKMNHSIRIKSLEDIIYSYIQMLKAKNIIHPQYSNYIIQINKLSKILTFIINSYNSSENIPQFYQKLIKEDNKFTDFMRKSEYNKRTPADKLQFKQLLTFESSVYQCTIYNQNHTNLQTQLKQLELTFDLLKKDIKQLRAQKEELQLDVFKKNNEFTIINFQIEKLQYDFDQYIKREEYVKSIINAKEGVLADLEKRRYDIVNIYQEQHMISIRECFEEFKRLQSNLFLFANFLQCHPLGQRTYEQSKRTICNQRLLEKEIRELKRMLSSPTHTSNDKESFLTLLLERYHHEYREIIEQLQSVIRDKTDFIHKYTVMMSEWQEKQKRKQQILAKMKDCVILQEVQCEKIKLNQADYKSVSTSMRKAIDNIIKLFKACQPLF